MPALLVWRSPKHKSTIGHKHLHASACRILLGEFSLAKIPCWSVMSTFFSVGLIIFNPPLFGWFQAHFCRSHPQISWAKSTQHSRAAEAHGAANHHRSVCLPGLWPTRLDMSRKFMPRKIPKGIFPGTIKVGLPKSTSFTMCWSRQHQVCISPGTTRAFFHQSSGNSPMGMGFPDGLQMVTQW